MPVKGSRLGASSSSLGRACSVAVALIMSDECFITRRRVLVWAWSWISRMHDRLRALADCGWMILHD